jgi:lipid-binding SYLF domain-containing protein
MPPRYGVWGYLRGMRKKTMNHAWHQPSFICGISILVNNGIFLTEFLLIFENDDAKPQNVYVSV